MNNILITDEPAVPAPPHTYLLSYSDANKMLPILRADHFKTITLSHPAAISISQLKFTVQFTRLLTSDGKVIFQGNASAQLNGVLRQLGLFSDQESIVFYKTRPEVVETQSTKLAIGFHSLETDQVDEDELLEGENLTIAKKKAESCATKPRACANCSCGRKDQEQPALSKQQLVEAVNEGKPVSGCGKCSMGDSFRCATCPFNGMPAFKPGDKLRLEESGTVVVQQASTFVSTGGKVKLEL